MPKDAVDHAKAEAEMLERLNTALHESGMTTEDLVNLDDGPVITLAELTAELQAKGYDPADLDYLYE